MARSAHPQTTVCTCIAIAGGSGPAARLCRRSDSARTTATSPWQSGSWQTCWPCRCSGRGSCWPKLEGIWRARSRCTLPTPEGGRRRPRAPGKRSRMVALHAGAPAAAAAAAAAAAPRCRPLPPHVASLPMQERAVHAARRLHHTHPGRPAAATQRQQHCCGCRPLLRGSSGSGTSRWHTRCSGSARGSAPPGGQLGPHHHERRKRG